MMQADDGRAAAQRSGLEAEVVFCSNNPATQHRQILTALQLPEGRRPVAVILQPSAVVGFDALARSAVEAGVGWIVLDAAPYLDGLRREFPGKALALVAADNREMGRLMGKLIRTLLPRGGRAVHLEGPSLISTVVHRRSGMLEGLDGSGVEITKTLAGDWSEASGEKAITFWLKLGSRKERPDLVVAQNDSMAAGAHRAVHALRPEWGEIAFTGYDGLPNGGQRLVREGVLAGTVVQPTTLPTCVELVARSLRGEQVPPATLLAPRTYPSLEEVALRGRK